MVRRGKGYKSYPVICGGLESHLLVMSDIRFLVFLVIRSFVHLLSNPTTANNVTVVLKPLHWGHCNWIKTCNLIISNDRKMETFYLQYVFLVALFYSTSRSIQFFATRFDVSDAHETKQKPRQSCPNESSQYTTVRANVSDLKTRCGNIWPVFHLCLYWWMCCWRFHPMSCLYPGLYRWLLNRSQCREQFVK